MSSVAVRGRVARLRIANDGIVADVAVGTTLQDFCDTHATSVVFGCRRASCGSCMIRVVEGGENLSQLLPNERELLDILGAGPDRRLACQCTVLGNVMLEIVD